MPSADILASLCSMHQVDIEWLLLGPTTRSEGSPAPSWRLSPSDLALLRTLKAQFTHNTEAQALIELSDLVRECLQRLDSMSEALNKLLADPDWPPKR